MRESVSVEAFGADATDRRPGRGRDQPDEQRVWTWLGRCPVGVHSTVTVPWAVVPSRNPTMKVASKPFLSARNVPVSSKVFTFGSGTAAAVANDAGQPTIVGGGRYVVVQPGQAEVALAIVDAYQGLGIGSALMRHLATLGRDAGLGELIAEVLAENASMLNVFERSGLTMNTRREGPVVHVTLRSS